jgi:ribosomal protein S18 acetylase RimI-like enzyme
MGSFIEMGFGIDQIKGFRPIGQQLSPERISAIEDAVLDDVDDLARLWTELATYHTRSPILLPALIDLPAIRSELVATIEDEHRTILIARVNGNAVGMIEAHPDAHYQGTVTIGLNIVAEQVRSQGIGTALLHSVMRWSRSADYQYCAVSWASANLVSDAFYRAHGFAPIRYGLARRIDPRVSWANESLDLPLLDSAWRSAESDNH